MTKDIRLGLILSEIALLILLGANVYQLYRGHGDLSQALDGQKTSDEQIVKINAQLDALASGTRRLAESGNPNAAKIMQVLAQNGISIKPKSGS